MPKSRAAGGSRETSRPAWRIVPLVWTSSPAITRSRVDLPQPDGPRKHTKARGGMSRSIALERLERPVRLGQARISR